MNKVKFIVVFVTAKDAKQAKRIADGLVKEKLAACVNIAGAVDSVFWWAGKVDRAKEVLLVVKTKKDLLEKVCRRVKALHSYEVPEIIALPLVGGSWDYLKWIDETV